MIIFSYSQTASRRRMQIFIIHIKILAAIRVIYIPNNPPYNLLSISFPDIKKTY